MLSRAVLNSIAFAHSLIRNPRRFGLPGEDQTIDDWTPMFDRRRLMLVLPVTLVLAAIMARFRWLNRCLATLNLVGTAHRSVVAVTRLRPWRWLRSAHNNSRCESTECQILRLDLDREILVLSSALTF